MKIKLIALVLIMVLAVCCVLVACNDDKGMFRKNQERVGKQITADATYNGRVGVVTLNDLYASFNNYYSYLYSYYQYGLFDAETFQSYLSDLDDTFSKSNDSLARDALYQLKCIDYLYNYYKANCADREKVSAMESKSTVGSTYNFKTPAGLSKYYKERYEEINAIFACDPDDYYIKQAIKYANDAMQKLYDQYIEEVEAEYAAAETTVDTDETPSGYVGIRLTQLPSRTVYEKGDSALNTNGLIVEALYKDADPVVIPTEYLTISGFSSSSVTASQTITVQYGKYSKTFEISIVDALPTKGETSDETEEEEEDEGDVEYFSFAVLESDYVKGDQTEEERKAAIRDYRIHNTAMNRVLKYLEENYRDYDYYLYLGYTSQLETAVNNLLTKDTVVTMAQLEEKYNEQVAKEIEGYATTPYSKDSVTDSTIVHKNYAHTSANNGGYYYVTQILIKFDAATLKKALDAKSEKISTEEAFNEYLLSLVGEVTAYTYNPEYDADATCELEECDCPRCANYSGNNHYDFDTIEKWYGLDENFVDPCKNNHTGEITCTCAACPTKKYAEKVNAKTYLDNVSDALNAAIDIQEKVEVFNTFVNEINADSGIFSNIKEGKAGYLMTPKGISSGMIQEFEDKCLELAATGVGSYGYTIGEYETDKYGIHFIMVTEFVTDDGNGEVTEISVKEPNDYVRLGLNYVTNIYAEAEEDENPVVLNGDVTVNLEAGTIAYYLWKDLLEERKNVVSGEFKKDFLSKEAGNALNFYPKTYKSTVKDLQKSINGED